MGQLVKREVWIDKVEFVAAVGDSYATLSKRVEFQSIIKSIGFSQALPMESFGSVFPAF